MYWNQFYAHMCHESIKWNGIEKNVMTFFF